MKPSLKIHIGRTLTLLLVWILLLACNLSHLPASPTTAPEINPDQPTGTASKISAETRGTATSTDTPLSQVIPTATITTTSIPIRPGSLAISDRYPLPYGSFFGMGVITTPGKVWVGTLNGMVEVVDAQSGQVLQSIALFPDSGGMTQERVYDLKYDGQHVWVLASSKKSAKPDTLVVIDEASGALLKQFDASEWEGELDQKMGYSPGRIWASHQWIDTETFEVQFDTVPWGDAYAYDGNGWMWITGNWYVSDCSPVLSVVDINDPSQHYSAWARDLKGDACAMPITLIGDRMWVVVSAPAGDGTHSTALWAYPADGSKMTKETHEPLVMIPSPEDQPIALIGNQDGLWMLGNNGYLYQFDPQTGELLNSLELYGPDERQQFSMNIVLDDHDLWVLTTNQLWRIHLR